MRSSGTFCCNLKPTVGWLPVVLHFHARYTIHNDKMRPANLRLVAYLSSLLLSSSIVTSKRFYPKRPSGQAASRVTGVSLLPPGTCLHFLSSIWCSISILVYQVCDRRQEQEELVRAAELLLILIYRVFTYKGFASRAADVTRYDRARNNTTKREGGSTHYAKQRFPKWTLFRKSPLVGQI